jgi:phospholipase C
MLMLERRMRQATFPILRRRRLLATSDGVILGCLTLVICGCGYPLSPTIQHVVIIVQENRTPDNLFHGLPNADIADFGVNSKGERIPLTPIPLRNTYDLDHSHEGFLAMYHKGKMDGADHVSCGPDCPPHPQFRYVDPSDVAPYLELAKHYTFADRMFQTNQGPSFPAHQFIISGTSAPTAHSDWFAAENVSGPFARGLRSFLTTGCAGQGQSVALINPSGKETQTVPPCFEHPTLMDLLDPQNISWRYYTIGASWENALWTAPNAIRHLRFGPGWNNVIPSPTQILTDVANGQLPNVSWVIPSGQNSDHARANLGSGPSWVAAVVNSIGNSPYWFSTAIFIVWDDWGGWYDHVAPPIYNSYEYGFRVPLIVVSPYAKAHFVSHKRHDFGSILRFIEENFSLPTLGYADSRADDLSDCFDYTQVPLLFQTISSPLPVEHFLEDATPPSPPDDD